MLEQEELNELFDRIAEDKKKNLTNEFIVAREVDDVLTTIVISGTGRSFRPMEKLAFNLSTYRKDASGCYNFKDRLGKEFTDRYNWSEPHYYAEYKKEDEGNYSYELKLILEELDNIMRENDTIVKYQSRF